MESQYFNLKEKREMVDAVAEMREPIKEILEQLRKRLDKGRYGIIIGDDASGRLPALILNKIIQTINKKRSFAGPKTVFFAGSRGLEGRAAVNSKVGEIEDKLKKVFSKETGERALVVTEFILSGRSIETLTQALKNLGIEFDIATLGLGTDVLKNGKKRKEFIERKLGGKIFSGGVSDPTIAYHHDLSGVEKMPQNVFSKRHKDVQYLDSEEGREWAQSELGRARKDGGLLADELTAWYFSLKAVAKNTDSDRR